MIAGNLMQATEPREDASVTETWTIAIDTGGTFTDAVAYSSEGRQRSVKVPSVPSDPSRALVDAVEELAEQGVVGSQVTLVFHGTTVATNAILTGSLARTVLLATEGFRDILGYRSGSRPDVYDLRQDRPDEFVHRDDRLEVRERLSAGGDVLTPLTDDEIERLVTSVRERAPEAVAVCLLFSFVDDDHERRLERRLREALPDVPISISSGVAREFREYPRTVTTVVNASLRPLVGRYLLRARDALHDRGLGGHFMVMQSNGGGVPAERAEREAHRLLLSGPAAGVAGAVSLATSYGVERLISLDMGGTSVDVCLARDGMPPVTAMQHLGPHPIIAPSVDIVTVGAGGGSIVEVDSAGGLRVGPRSAGADPGPVAYGRGGAAPTLTDAHVVAGTLGDDAMLAGRLRLDAEAARRAVARIADEMEIDVETAAEGIIALATSHLEGAIRQVSVEAGEDPREYTLVAFGGAGPLHAGQLLRDLELPAVLIPRYPGLFSAEGLLAADLRIDDAWSVLRILDDDVAGVMAQWRKESQANLVRQLEEDGVARDAVRLVSSVDCRYLGQGYELNVTIDDMVEQLDPAIISDRFQRLHRAVYGHTSPDDPVEAVTVRCSAFGRWAHSSSESAVTSAPGRETRPADAHALDVTRRLRFRGSRSRVATPVYVRERLQPLHHVDGPAIIVQLDTTIVVLPGQRASVDHRRNIWLEETER